MLGLPPWVRHVVAIATLIQNDLGRRFGLPPCGGQRAVDRLCREVRETHPGLCGGVTRWRVAPEQVGVGFSYISTESGNMLSTAFTRFGVDNLTELVEMYKADPDLLRRYPPPE